MPPTVVLCKSALSIAQSSSLTAITDPVGPWVALKTAVKRATVQKRRINNATNSIYVSDDILRYFFIPLLQIQSKCTVQWMYLKLLVSNVFAELLEVGVVKL